MILVWHDSCMQTFSQIHCCIGTVYSIISGNFYKVLHCLHLASFLMLLGRSMYEATVRPAYILEAISQEGLRYA